MSKFLLFAGYSYYPAGGWGDFCGAFDSAEAARVGFLSVKEKIERFADEPWAHIVDAEASKVVLVYDYSEDEIAWRAPRPHESGDLT